MPLPWPSTGLSPAAEKLIRHFFCLVDVPRTDAGLLMAAEVFTEDGVFAAASGYFQGKDIEKCREAAWSTVRYRHHEIRKVYLNDAEDLDLIIVGAVTTRGVENPPETHDFVARALLADPDSDNPRIKHYQVLVPTPKH